jgi:hypothetical protein
MSAQENLELVHRMYDALNAQDLEAHDKYWTKDMIWHGPAGMGDFHGLDAFKYELLRPFYKATIGYPRPGSSQLRTGASGSGCRLRASRCVCASPISGWFATGAL